MSPAIRLTGLDPREYEHPYDAKALNSLQKVPGLHHAVRQYNKHFVERDATIEFTGSHLRIARESYPDIYKQLDDVCEIVHLERRPNLYIKWGYEVNGETRGVDEPLIVLPSGAIDLLSGTELRFLLGHEVGHIKSRHTLYHQIAVHLGNLASVIGDFTLGIGNLVSQPLLLALYWWFRMSEFTADRAGLLACQDVHAAMRVMMKWAGLPLKCYKSMNTDAFVAQARAFDQLDYDTLNRIWKLGSIAMSSHPWTVMRAAELLRWIESGEYQQVLDRKTHVFTAQLLSDRAAFCQQCGQQLKGDEAFCFQCGQRLGA